MNKYFNPVCNGCGEECQPVENKPEYWEHSQTTFILSDCCSDFVSLGGFEMDQQSYKRYVKENYE